MSQNNAIGDETLYLTITAALKFRARVPRGEDAIFKYILSITFQGGNTVAQVLGTDVLQEPVSEREGPCRVRDCAFANFRLPLVISDSEAGEGIKETRQWPVLSTLGATKFAAHLHENCESALWVRLSGQIYMDLDY
ncbi:aminotransferase [Penicillium lividum]|nr:aminotransferase [Penicillium lividum]